MELLLFAVWLFFSWSSATTFCFFSWLKIYKSNKIGGLFGVFLMLCVCGAFAPEGPLVPFFTGTILGHLYAPSYWDGSERTGSRRWPWFCELRFRNFVRAFSRWYFDFGVDMGELWSSPLPPQAIYAIHPHGLWHVSGMLALAHDDFEVERIRFALTRHVFSIPILREIFLWIGCVSADREVLDALLDDGFSIGLAPGGVKEMTLADVNRLDLYFGHEGFLRLAEARGVPVVPIFARGENRIFVKLPFFGEIQRALSTLIGYPFPLFHVPFPFPTPLRLFVGRPVHAREDYWKRLLELIRAHEPRAHPDLQKKIDDLSK